MKRVALLITCAAAALATPASAATITYTLDGNFNLGFSNLPVVGSGSINNVALSFTGTGDTNSSSSTNLLGLNVTVVPLSSFVAKYNGPSVPGLATGSSFDLATLTSLEFVNAASVGGFGFGSLAGNFGAAFTGLPVGYNGLTSLAPTSVSFALGFPVTVGGASGTFTGASNVTFSASVAAIPEPATWALMIAGFGMVGAAMRRRATRTTVTYA